MEWGKFHTYNGKQWFNTLCCAPAADFYLYFPFSHRFRNYYRWKPVWILDLWDLMVFWSFIACLEKRKWIDRFQPNRWICQPKKKHRRTCHVISFQLLFSSVQLIHDYHGFEVYALFCFVRFCSISENNAWNSNNVKGTIDPANKK